MLALEDLLICLCFFQGWLVYGSLFLGILNVTGVSMCFSISDGRWQVNWHPTGRFYVEMAIFVGHAMLWKASIRKETWAFFSSLPAEAQQQHQPWWFVIPEVCGKNAKKTLGLDPLVLDKPMDVEDQH